ncbi:MAG TPA: hypothetical protein VIK33_17745 [Anaerolineae bacterium]
MKGKRHPLLIYGRIHRQRRGLFLSAALIVLFFYVVIAWPLVDQATLKTWWLWPQEYDILLLIAVAIFFLAFLYKWVAPRLAYVQCTERNLRIQTPLYPLALSYRRIVTTRPNQWGRVYPSETLTRRQRRILDPIGGEGVLILDLKGWPMSRSILRWWIPDVMFTPAGDGLVLWVPDWMALSREISHFTDIRREARMGSKPDASVYGRMKREDK